jgi:hypothetical protein
MLIRIADYLECSSAEVTFSDDVLFTRRHRPKETTPLGGGSASSSNLVISAVQASPDRLRCEVRVAFRHRGMHAACRSACLSEVLSIFAAHFLRLAASESRAPVLHIFSDDDEPYILATRRAA